jgi:hypothetical protein
MTAAPNVIPKTIDQAVAISEIYEDNEPSIIVDINSSTFSTVKKQKLSRSKEIRKAVTKHCINVRVWAFVVFFG